MTVYPANLYRDPSETLDGIRAKQCDGCQNEAVFHFKDEKTRTCEKGKKHSDNGGERCKLFIRADKNGNK